MCFREQKLAELPQLVVLQVRPEQPSGSGREGKVASPSTDHRSVPGRAWGQLARELCPVPAAAVLLRWCAGAMLAGAQGLWSS